MICFTLINGIYYGTATVNGVSYALTIQCSTAPNLSCLLTVVSTGQQVYSDASSTCQQLVFLNVVLGGVTYNLAADNNGLCCGSSSRSSISQSSISQSSQSSQSVAPVSNNCCPGGLPNILHCTTSLDGTVTLIYDGSQYWASSDFASTCGSDIRLRFSCPGVSGCGGFNLEGSCDHGVTWWSFLNSGGCHCPPAFSVPFYATGIPLLHNCGTCEGVSATATVTL
jgi:hypothetical protein